MRRRALTPRLARRAAMVAAGMLVLTACASSPTPPAHELAEGITVSLMQLRSDIAERHAQVHIHNGTDTMLYIGELRVDDPRFAEPAVRVIDRESQVRPGTTVNVRIQLPTFACPASGAGGSVLTVNLSHGGHAASTTTPIAEEIPFLGAMYERECFGQRLAEVVAVSFGEFTPSEAGEPAALLLELAPRPGATGTGVIRGIHETNLITFEATTAVFSINAHFAQESAHTTVVLPLMPWRCDPHAVQEDKRGTVFTVDAEVDGVAGQIELAASPELRGRILGWVASWCGFGG